MKLNLWVWSELTQKKKPNRKAGDAVPIGYLIEGATEYHPPHSWIQKGYVEKVEMKQTTIFDYLEESG
ncbi:hypothetical protein ACIQLG_19860 [Terribacillus saccharophilus]|uniref:hypothetical protein n=1 Tax=Terribacillus saccharophilus TaxID=361277 RepID=UPI00380DFB22